MLPLCYLFLLFSLPLHIALSILGALVFLPLMECTKHTVTFRFSLSIYSYPRYQHGSNSFFLGYMLKWDFIKLAFPDHLFQDSSNPYPLILFMLFYLSESMLSSSLRQVTSTCPVILSLDTSSRGSFSDPLVHFRCSLHNF